MLDTDKLLMTRAIDLARRGAGLVSPNPLVGAVLVNGGRVVGEGYHRYDRLKHAESYALENAQALARGATLYCNLEPCCHHGRTPPCTGALIAAGISRAVIAVKDPDRRVNGQGVDQLREAGVDVEVGLLEDRARRVNETYFKFITSGRPFVHGVIKHPLCPRSSTGEWRPSSQLLLAASEYDAVVIGNLPEINRAVIEAAVERQRHRALVVVTGDADERPLKGLSKSSAKRISVVPLRLSRADGDAPRSVVRMDEAVAPAGVRSQVGSVLASLARLQVTSVLVLPGLMDLIETSNFAEFDKLTLVLPGDASEVRLSTRWVVGNLEFDLDDGEVSDAAGYTELTGYPSLRGVA